MHVGCGHGLRLTPLRANTVKRLEVKSLWVTLEQRWILSSESEASAPAWDYLGTGKFAVGDRSNG